VRKTATKKADISASLTDKTDSVHDDSVVDTDSVTSSVSVDVKEDLDSELTSHADESCSCSADDAEVDDVDSEVSLTSCDAAEVRGRYRD